MFDDVHGLILYVAGVMHLMDIACTMLCCISQYAIVLHVSCCIGCNTVADTGYRVIRVYTR